jgi:RNA polymerase sigma factor for flagellar operon FliA
MPDNHHGPGAAPGPLPLPAAQASHAALAQEDMLWQRWRDQGEDAAREAIARHYMSYARAVAAQLYRRRASDEVEFADYLQFAALGMLESIERFDPAQGVLFKTFATPRMTGAVRSGIASHSERQQQMVMRRRIAQERSASLRDDPAGPGPESVLRELAGLGVGLALGFILDGTGMVENVEGALPDNTYANVELRQFQDRIVHLLRKLTPREQEVVKLHYFHSVGFEEIAQQLSLTRGRVSQLHKQALGRLRTLLADTVVSVAQA